ncbi:MAG: hypothetical protein U5L45_09040 [Saprospiraceae bacterium]|nr:hypothetical protein [Saprospiraceae bacterium]
MEKFTFFELKESDLLVKIEKLSNQEYDRSRDSKFAPVFEDYYFFMVLDRLIYEKYDFTLPKIYAALYTRFGKHNGYDDYKCSFSYRFRLTIVNKNNTYTYRLSLMDMKGNPPYFTFYRQLGENELDQKNYYQNPIETEFSKEAMKEFMVHFVGYLLSTFESIKDTFKKPFFRTVPYAHIIYGFEEGEFFEDYYDQDDETKGDNEEEDNGDADYLDALEEYKNTKKMKGAMSARYD